MARTGDRNQLTPPFCDVLSTGRILAALTLAAAIAGLAGCAPSSLASARSQISAGNFMAARQDLIRMSARSDLSPSERRELNDDLCLADFMIGRPAVSLAEQRRVCAAAASDPASQSGAVVAQLHEQAKQIDSQQFETAIADGDLAGAERAALDYRGVPGADSTLLLRWSDDIWNLADTQMLTDSGNNQRNLKTAIAELRKDYPEVRGMDDAAFRRWVETTARGSGTALAPDVEVGKSKLRLSIDTGSAGLAALNLDKLATINDGFAARCGCDAHTDVSILPSGLPAYIVRLDAETRMSEVMILPRPDQTTLLTSAR